MTAGFQQQMDRFIQKTRAREAALYEGVQEHVGRSIKFGSAVTGAPGQPVKSGDLLGSWRRDRRGVRFVRWTSDLIYAGIIEDNRRGAQLRSKVGGFHSVKLTRAGFRAIVSHELRMLNATQDAGGRYRIGGRFVARWG